MSAKKDATQNSAANPEAPALRLGASLESLRAQLQAEGQRLVKSPNASPPHPTAPVDAEVPGAPKTCQQKVWAVIRKDVERL